MTPVLLLPYGWCMVRDANTGRPWFKRRGHAITPHDLAGLPEARTVFREVKRELDKRDAAFVRLDDQDFRAIDMAKIGLELSLRARHRWSPDLSETGIFRG